MSVDQSCLELGDDGDGDCFGSCYGIPPYTAGCCPNGLTVDVSTRPVGGCLFVETSFSVCTCSSWIYCPFKST